MAVLDAAYLTDCDAAASSSSKTTHRCCEAKEALLPHLSDRRHTLLAVILEEPGKQRQLSAS